MAERVFVLETAAIWAQCSGDVTGISSHGDLHVCCGALLFGACQSWGGPLNAASFFAAKNTVVRGLENVEVPEGGEALFECQLSQPEVAAHTWLLDDEPVHSSDRAEVVYFEDGLRHLLLLKNLRPQDSCRVTFLAGDVVTSAFLTVRGECVSQGQACGGGWVGSILRLLPLPRLAPGDPGTPSGCVSACQRAGTFSLCTQRGRTRGRRVLVPQWGGRATLRC